MMGPMGNPTGAYQHLYAALEEDPTPEERAQARSLMDDLAHLVRLGGCVERATTVTSVEPGDDHLRFTLERADGSRETVRAHYLIGAGGAGLGASPGLP